MWLLLLRRLGWSWIFPALGMYPSARRSAESDVCRSWRGKSVEHRRSSERGDIFKIAQAVSITVIGSGGEVNRDLDGGLLGLHQRSRTVLRASACLHLLWHRARFHIPDLRRVLGDCAVAGEFARASYVENGLARPSVAISVKMAELPI